jgi:putative tricarboxylic transport membrane protein
MIRDKLTALGLFGFSVIYIVGGWDLKLGTLKKPGPGLLPLLVGTGLLVCTVIYLWQAFKKPAAPVSSLKSFDLKTAAWLIAAVLAYPVLLNYLNFILATFAVVYLMLLVLKFKRPAWGLVVSMMIVVACFMVFAVLLGVTLPSGPIEEILYRLRG